MRTKGRKERRKGERSPNAGQGSLVPVKTGSSIASKEHGQSKAATELTVSSHAVADAMRDKQANASDKETSKSSSSSKRSSAERKGKNGKQKIKQKQQPPPPMSTRTKDGEETGDEDAPEGSRPKRSAPKSTASLLDLDPDDFMAGLADAGLEDDDSDGDGSEEDDKEQSLDEESNDSADSDDEEANAAAMMGLNNLAETDPEFYKFLQKEEPTLLEFDPMEGDSDESGDESRGQQEEADGADAGASGARKVDKFKDPMAALKGASSGGGGVTLTMPVLKVMAQEAFERKSVKGVKIMIKAFRCGCHLGDEAGDDSKGGAGVQKFRIPSSEVYNELMVSALEGLHPVIVGMLFPHKEPEASASESSSAAAAHTSSSNGGVPGKRRRVGRRRVRGEEANPADPAAETADSNGEEHDEVEDEERGQGPAKKKTRKGKNKEDISTESTTEEQLQPELGVPHGITQGKAGHDGANSASTILVANDKASTMKDRRGGNERKLEGVKPRVLILSKEDFRAAAQLPVWKAMQPALYSFFKSFLHVLEELKDRSLLAFLLSKLDHYTPLLVPFPGLARGYLKALLGLWGGAGDEVKGNREGRECGGTEGAERVRLLAYLRVRQMAAVLPFPFVEGCMKGLYLAFAKMARAPPVSTEAKTSLRVMEGCVVELYGMDMASAYQNAFLYIRQLSLMLRRSMQQKTKDSFQAVRRWQVLTCLRVWTGVLAAAPAEDELRMLFFPLAQVIEGIMRLCATLRHAPFAFQLVRMRQRLAAAAGLYVPCAAPLLMVLRSPALFKKATASTDAPPNVPAILRLGKTQVGEGRAQAAVVTEALRLLGQEMDLYRYSAAFPELVIPVLGHLRKFVKATKVSRWRMMARGLVETLEARGTWAAARREALGLCPKEAEGLEPLRPEGAPRMRERLGASEAEIERIDESTVLAGPGSAVPPPGTQKSNKNRGPTNEGKTNQTDSESDDVGRSADEDSSKDDEYDDIDDDDDDADDDDDSEAQNTRFVSSNKQRKSKEGNPVATKKPVMKYAAMAVEDVNVAAPDMVGDLGVWSDDEEW